MLLVLALAAAIAWAPFAAAQGVTTGALSGTVTDQEGGVLPGVVVEAVHTPTNTTYTSVTTAEGRYRIPNARVGGPYTVSANLEGFVPQQKTDLDVRLGQTEVVDFELSIGAIEEAVTVVGTLDLLISPERTGSSSNVSTYEVENLPTLNRGFEDFARTNPFMTVAQVNDGPAAVSVAGRNTRFNNIQIDGAVNNDLFGLADQGTPGGQADTTPISLDAIQEFQLVVAEFDVRQGGFSGGSINAITRSGSNDWKGSLFYFTRDDGWVGDLSEDNGGEFGTFEEEQYGFRLGGPALRDKVFFFVNGEISEKTTPAGWSIDGSGGRLFSSTVGGQTVDLVDEAELFRQTLIDRYGFDPGGLGEDTRETPSDKLFGRLDFNISASHQLTFRHNYVDAQNDVNFPGPSSFEFPSEAYTISNETNSTVLQLNSVLGSTMFNEARVTYQTVEDRRAGRGGVRFPWIEVEDVLGGADSARREFEAGTEPFSTANELDQDVLEITDDFTWIRGDHTFVIGTHNELFSFRNLFLQNAFGAYEYRTLDDFLNDSAYRFQYTVVPPGQARAQSFDVNQLGLYAGDQWQVRPDLTVTYGLRVDAPFFPDDPSRNQFTETTYGFRTDEMPDGELLWQPRAGFNWDISGNGTQQLRGGGGIFAGRSPYVWISNNYARTGIEQQFVTVFGSIPFNPNPDGQVIPGGGSTAIGEFNLIDPDFEFPQVARLNLGYDRELPWFGLVGTIEGIYSESLEEITYKNVNLRQVGNLPFDGRPVFEEVDSGVDGAYLITNTGKGEATNLVAKLERPYRGDGFTGFVAYAYGDSTVVNDGTSSRAVSNWQFNEAPNPNDPPTSTSDYEVEHRFTASVAYSFNRRSPWRTTASLFYNHQSGRPYTYLLGTSFALSGSFNGDGAFSNDLFYVPASESDVEIFSGGTWADLDEYIRSEPCLERSRGGIAPRNCAEGPWSQSLDLRLAQAIPVGFGNAEVTLDLVNLLNLVDEDSGLVKFVNFGTTTVARYRGLTADGRPIYELANLETPYQLDNERSRWRAKLGLRWTF
jgi:hypothetical protein